MSGKRIIRFVEGYWHPTYGLFKKGHVYQVPDNIQLPTESKLNWVQLNGREQASPA